MKRIARSMTSLCFVALAASFAATASASFDRTAPPKLMKRWASPDAAPGDGLPGWYSKTPTVHIHQPSNLPRIPAAEAELLKRRATIAFEALMQQPSLHDVRGTSLQADINISVVPTDEGVRLVQATLSINAKSVIEGKADTVQREGRYVTPSEEGAVLRIFLNPFEFLARRGVSTERAVGRVQELSVGSSYALLVSDAPAQAEWVAREAAVPMQHDRSWYQPGAAGMHPLLVHVSSYRQENEDLRADKLGPERPVSRLAAAMLMVDWEDVHRHMVEAR